MPVRKYFRKVIRGRLFLVFKSAWVGERILYLPIERWVKISKMVSQF